MTQTTESPNTKLGRTRRHPRTSARIRSAGARRSVFLLVAVAMLLTIGLGAMLSASSVVSIRSNAGQFELFTKQIVWVGLGLGAMVVTAFVPYRVWQKFALPIFSLVVVGLIVTLVVGDARGGATRWIVVGPVTIQVAEFEKLINFWFCAPPSHQTSRSKETDSNCATLW